MSASTDTFGFNAEKMFEVLRDCLPDECVTQNIIECKDDMLFAWNSKNSCVLALNWTRGHNNQRAQYQTLIPSAQQNYIVNKVLPSNEGNLLAICGSRGVSIIELPRRWGENGQYENGKECIICRTHSLDERIFMNNAHLQVLQMRWHPASPTDSHLLVLYSDNSIRVYDDTMQPSFTLRHTWRVGPVPSILNVSKSNTSLPMLNSLGDTAVDFDLAPPRISPHSGSEARVEWPIIILRGNGNVYVLCAGVDTERPHLQGPLTLLPQVHDNYGLDSCSILVLPTLPPTIIIAESTGKLHHGLLIDADPNEDFHNTFDEIDTSLVLVPSEWSLYILESVELELGLKDLASDSFTCPLFLKKDILNDYRYFVYHNAGLHAISVNFVHQLEDYINGDNREIPMLNAASHAEYVLCTKALNASKLNPILGFTLCRSPSGLVVLLGSGQVISLDLITDPSLIRGWPVPKQSKTANIENSPMQNMFKETFTNRVHSILKTDVTQPILKLSANPTPQESFELLMQATQVFREQQFTRHEKARQEIEKRVKTLHLLKEQQLKEIQTLESEKRNIRDKAEKLAESYEDICENQQSLLKRAQDLVRLSTLRLPHTSTQEKEFANNLQTIKTKADNLMKLLEKARLRMKTQENMKDVSKGDKRLVLPNNKDEAIRKILTEMTHQIESQVNDVKKINSFININ